MDLVRIPAVMATDPRIDPNSDQFQATATALAETYDRETATIRRLVREIDQSIDRLNQTFKAGEIAADPGRVRCFHEFTLGYTSRARDVRADSIEPLFRRDAWELLIDMLGIKNVMTPSARRKFDKQMADGEMPPISRETVTGVIMGLVDQAKDFAESAAREVFEFLTPDRSGLKTNSPFRVGRRVIVRYGVDEPYRSGRFSVSYHRDGNLVALDQVMHMLDGRGVMRENRGELVAAINNAPGGRGETTYFRFKAFKNRNLHLEFRRLDLVKQLNYVAAGERVLGDRDCNI